MDVFSGIGAAASVITLVDLAVNVAGETAKLCQDFADAPRQLQAVSARTTLLRTLLEDLSGARDGLSALDTLSPSCEDVLRQSLRCTWAATIEIQRVRNKHCDAYKLGSRFRWALLSKRKSDQLLQTLQHAELELILALNLVQCHSDLALMASIKGIQSTLNRRLDSSNFEEKDEAPRNKFQSATSIMSNNGSMTQMIASYTLSTNIILRKLGINGCFLSYYCKNERTDHLIFRMPFLLKKAVLIDFSIKTFALAGSRMSTFRQNLSLRNVIPETSPIVVASTQGDLPTVQTLFENRAASPFDMTVDGETPLELAIESGNINLVSYLLQEGADPNTIVDESSGMSVLQQALSNRNTEIARLLLSRGACRWHIDANGWTNASYIWARRQDDGKRSQDCLKLLLSECCPALSSYDVQNWTVLHRAAAFGSAEDINLLLNSGANPRATVNTWTPAFYAICLKNFSAVPKLAKMGFDINYQDGGGWTLLHMAAWTKSKSVMKFLFKLGADPHIKGTSYELYWKDCHGRSNQALPFEHCITPLDIARIQGEKAFSNFVEAAQEANFDLTVDANGELFWDAEEDLSQASPL